MTPRLAVLVRDAATADLAEAADWYEQRRGGLGVEFLRAARALLAAIGRAPFQFPIARGAVRRARVRRFPYVVYFIPDPTRVVVIAVMHGRRDPRRWEERVNAEGGGADA
jgi:plasmid stabilization system protein ParE